MKKTILILLLAVCSNLATLFAQDRQQAFFVYRNDGDFNVFFFNNVDSITYSKLDTDSLLCDDYVTQEVWTTDSVFRIPTAAIDSVAFKPLPTIYKSDVTVISPELESYILKVDSLTLCLKPSVPQSLIPKVGEKLVTTAVNNTFTNGFIGTVKNVENGQDTIKVNCGRLFLEDAFEQYYAIRTTEYVCEDENTAYASLSQNASLDINIPFDTVYKVKPITIRIPKDVINNLRLFNATINTPEHLKLEISKWEASGSVNLEDFIDELRYTIVPHFEVHGSLVIRNNNINLDTYVYNKTKSALNFGFASTFELNKDIISKEDSIDLKEKIEAYLKDRGGSIEISLLPPYLTFSYNFGVGASLEGEVALAMLIEQKSNDNFHITFNNQRLIPLQVKNLNKPTWPQLSPKYLFGKLSGNISFSAEGTINLISKYLLGIGLSIEAGPSFAYSAPLYLAPSDIANRDTSGFEKLSDAKFSLGWFLNIAAGLKAADGLFKWEPLKGEWNYEIFERYYAPVFSEAQLQHFNNGENSIDITVDRNLISPVTVGAVIYDDENNSWKSYYKEEQYSNREASFEAYRFKVDDWKINKNYTIYPAIKWFGQELLAIPPKTECIKIKPMTDEPTNVGKTSATLMGHLEGYTDVVDENCKFGFYYGESPNVNGAKVYCDLGENYTLAYTLTNLKENTAYRYKAFIEVNGRDSVGYIKSFTTGEDEAVDLGLSVKWRKYNLGADSPEEYGDYYAWGETAAKEEYSWDTYFDSPYDENGGWKGSSITTDIYATEYDASTVTLGDKWRMPTREEMQELVDECDWTWDTLNGVDGYTVKGPNGNSIFLPAAGNYDGGSVSNAGMYGGYWTGTVGTSTSNSQAGNLYFFGETLHAVQWSNRYTGRTIRPVTE